MKIFKNLSLWAGPAYFLILLNIGLWVRDIPDQPDPFSATLQEVIATSPMGDPKSFATAAIDIAENGWISTPNDWIFNLWPPGFVLLEASIIKVLGPEAPVILVLQIFAALLFSIVLTLLYSLLSENMNRKIAFFLPLVIFAFPVSRVFLLEPTGLTLGESFSIGFFLTGILLILRAVRHKAICYAFGAGICLALAAYFRSQFEIILHGMTGWGLLLILAIITTKLSRYRNVIDTKLAGRIITTMFITLLIAHIATIPWRYYHWTFQGSSKWVHTSSVTFGNAVQTTEYLEGAGGGFVVAGGGNLVCRIDPTTCEDFENAQALFLKTLLQHPVQWYSMKLDVIGKYWFSSVENWSSVSIEATWIDIIINGVLLVVMMALLYLLFTRKCIVDRSWILLFWINASLFSTYFLIFTVQQFEVRYFYFPKIAGMVMLLILASLYWPQKKEDEPNNILAS
ncbi:hypothetical protein OAP18_01430 [Gammaproteobacteria bacterium]|nr:hypothetical protein [Gammaproteobacteria bacterium]